LGGLEMNDKQTLLGHLLKLLSRPSITPDDAGCQEYLANELTGMRFDCRSLRFGNVDNLIARIGTTRPILCFAGHTDVVPPGPLEAWHSDPFEPLVRDDHVTARGAADMKGSVAAMLVAFANLHSEQALSGSVMLVLTSDEEGLAVDGIRPVMRQLDDSNELPDWCIIGEPSSEKVLGDRIRVGRRGSLTGSLTVFGTQGHVAYAELADNPLRRFAPALLALLNRQWDHGNDYFPATTFEIVDLTCGSGADNVIPGELTLRFNFRYSTEWTADKLQQAVRALLDSNELRYELSWHDSGQPFLTKAGELTGVVQQSVRSHTGLDPECSTGGGTSDGRYIAPYDIPVVELGPVATSIHKPNECVSVNDLMTLSNIYRDVIDALLINRRC